MMNFGKMTVKPSIVKVYGVQYIIYLYCNADGVDLVEAARSNPHPFYIAIDENSRVISMTDDIEQSQIAGYEIIGIDSDYGETFGPGGSVYGKKWNGLRFLDVEL